MKGVKKGTGDLLVSYCGICCSLCPPYRAERCPGCPELKDCQIVQCAEKKKIQCCFLCQEFPCQFFEKGFDRDLGKSPGLEKHGLGVVKWKPYSQVYVNLFKIDKKEKDKGGEKCAKDDD